MANGTTRMALAEMQINGNKSGQHEMMEEIALESPRKGKMKKIPLKNPSEHNHSN